MTTKRKYARYNHKRNEVPTYYDGRYFSPDGMAWDSKHIAQQWHSLQCSLESCHASHHVCYWASEGFYANLERDKRPASDTRDWSSTAPKSSKVLTSIEDKRNTATMRVNVERCEDKGLGLTEAYVCSNGKWESWQITRPEAWASINGNGLHYESTNAFFVTYSNSDQHRITNGG